jgi:LPS sulfotransferase NodH
MGVVEGRCVWMSAPSYLICATPRTGSSLLCGLLESTGIAGEPESYFRQPDEHQWAARWGIAHAPDGGFDDADYFRAARRAGSTENGVFGARVMWGTLKEMVLKLGRLYPWLAGSDCALLDRAFGPMRFVYLRRDDVLRQAVSRLRAEQVDLWFETTDSPRRHLDRHPAYDFDQIEGFVQSIASHNAAWQRWFAEFGIRPHVVRYEELDADPEGVIGGILAFLDLQLPADRAIAARHRRLADGLNDEWVHRHLREKARRADGRGPSSGGSGRI